MALSDNELILLDNLIYYPDVFVEGDSVAQILDKITYQVNHNPESRPAEMSADEWMDIVSAIQSNEKLLNYKVTNLTTPSKDMNTGTVACFVDDVNHPSDVNVVFKGTQNGYEWDDNGEGAYLIDSDCQKAAADYINRLPESYGNHITVTGHSKGGNKAQYVTITTDRVARCVAEDGQGFSNEFCERYADVIEERKGRIRNYCAENDFVNVIATSIAGEVIYIETGMQMNPLHYHKPNILLDENGAFNDRGNQAGWTKSLHNYLQHVIDTMPEPQRSYVIDGVMGLLEKGESEESMYNRLCSVLTAGGYWLAWMIERNDWFGEASEYLANFIREATKLLSPATYYDLTYFSVDVSGLSVSQGNLEKHQRVLETAAEDIGTIKRGLKGISYGPVRASMDVLKFQLQQRAKACGKVSKAIERVCRDYQQNEQHVEGLF